jgi:hypothetical protein
MHDQRNQKQFQENEEQQLRDARCRHRYTRKPEYRSDDRNDQEYQCPIQHVSSFGAKASAFNQV